MLKVCKTFIDSSIWEVQCNFYTYIIVDILTKMSSKNRFELKTVILNSYRYSYSYRYRFIYIHKVYIFNRVPPFA